jgi:sec-independent protein translocase protein TatC
VNLSPANGFFVAFQVALYGGIVLASPFIFYFVAAFIFPALRMKEKYYVHRGLGFGLALFLTGGCFCYFLLMPVALAASQRYSQWLGFSAFQWKADEYISFVCKFILGMGLGFEMPVVILTLVKIGVLNYRILKAGRRYMIVINLVLGAILTTPEVITQIIMFVPLQLLYEISIWIAWYWEREEKKRQAAATKSGGTD